MRGLGKRTRWRAAAAWAAACSLAAGGLVAAGVVAATAATAAPGQGAQPAAASPVCQITYTVNSDWGTGFSIAITITNNGPAITSWTLAYSYTGNQKIAQSWSGNWSQSGEAITVTNASWNGSLATGGSTQIGANFSYTGTNTAPTAFTLNGNTCNGGPSPSPSPSPTSTGGGPAPQLHVSGNKLVNASGATVVLHGVDRSGTEYACVQGNGIFDGPNDQTSITAMKSWGVNAVRVPLNEACWNAESYVNPAYAGANYINAIKA